MKTPPLEESGIQRFCQTPLERFGSLIETKVKFAIETPVLHLLVFGVIQPII